LWDTKKEGVNMFEQTFKNIDNALRKDKGCASELDYIEQTSWILFLKYLEDFEKEKGSKAKLTGKSFSPIIAKDFVWSVWAAPKNKDGQIDYNKTKIGDDLIEFVEEKLFPYLKKFKTTAMSYNSIEYKIGEIFNELENKIKSGYVLREIISLIDELHFQSYSDKHEMSHLYESKIKNMGNAGRNGGEYYTPRPLIRTIVKIVNPKIGETVYDGALGSAGFLVEAFDYLRQKAKTAKDLNTLQKNTFYGKEAKVLPYVIGTMNMILHGVEAPNIIHGNTLEENLADIGEKDRFNVILANPPFGGHERSEVQHNFNIKTSETAYLFLQHFIKKLKAGGRAGIVIKNTFLSNTDNASIALRKELLESCNLHTVLDLPSKVFAAGVRTIILFFEKGRATEKIWFYQLNLDRNLGKTSPLTEKDLSDFIDLQKTKANSKNSWTIKVSDIDAKTFDLAVANPNAPKCEELKKPKEILSDIKKIDEEINRILGEIEL
jgi:type I restriction enzyme M protein